MTITKLDSDWNYMVYEDSHYKPSTKELMDTINYNNYGIQITHETEQEEVVSSRYFSNRMISSAYAANMEFLPLDTISTIQIITNQDFDSTHLAGSNISDLFQVIESFYYSSSDVYTVQEYLNMKGEHTRFQQGEPFLLHLNSSPMKKEKYEFTVKITLENAFIDVIEDKTKEIIITNQ